MINMHAQVQRGQKTILLPCTRERKKKKIIINVSDETVCPGFVSTGVS